MICALYRKLAWTILSHQRLSETLQIPLNVLSLVEKLVRTNIYSKNLANYFIYLFIYLGGAGTGSRASHLWAHTQPRSHTPSPTEIHLNEHWFPAFGLRLHVQLIYDTNDSSNLSVQNTHDNPFFIVKRHWIIRVNYQTIKLKMCLLLRQLCCKNENAMFLIYSLILVAQFNLSGGQAGVQQRKCW